MLNQRRTKLEDLTDISIECIGLAKQHLEVIKSLTDVKLMYIHCYQLMKLGGLEAEVPRLVVFGQQSMGKTTLLDFIMGGPIGYSSTDTGTKQPVSIIMKPLTTLNTLKETLKENMKEGSKANLKEKYKGNEEILLNETNSIVCKFNGRFMTIHEVQDAMRVHMQSLGQTILSDELEVEVYVPNALYAIFVDLPGIKDDSKVGAELTRSVVRNYVSNNPNDLYILVKKASDDPSNWPWSLKEFITSSAPAGLGLTPQQTMVVGTRAKEFLLNEKTDIKTYEELVERVYKRGVVDSKGQMLPLHLLELFSLSIQAKESGDFLSNRDDMKAQISTSQKQIYDLLVNSFNSTNLGDEDRLKEELFNIFSIDSFLKTLNHKFQSLMTNQLNNLERRLVRKKIELERQIAAMDGKLSRFSPQSLRESIKQFIRQLIEVVHNMITGNYTIMKLPIAPEQFMKIYGGNLHDNLQDGHELALNLFPMPEMYDPEFYSKIMKRTEVLYKKKLTMMDCIKPGRYVRYFTSRVNSHMFGLIEPPSRTNNSNNGLDINFDLLNKDYGSDELINVEFIQINNGVETSLHKNIDRNKLVLLTPLPSVSIERLQVPLYAWHKTQASTGWVLVRPIIIDRLPPEILIQKSNYREVDIANKQISFRYLDESSVDNTNVNTSDNEYPVNQRGDSGAGLGAAAGASKDGKEPKDAKDNLGASKDKFKDKFKDKYGGNTTTGSSQTNPSSGSKEEKENVKYGDRYLYFTNCSEIYLEDKTSTPYFNSALEMVSGEHADSNLLNQLAFTNVSHWLKFHIKHMEPEQVYTSGVLYQMLRSIHHVVDRADWEPLVADLVQSNVRGTLLHAARLSACACAAALRRVLRASLSEVFRCIQINDLDHSLLGLSESLHFQEQIDQLSEEFCRQKALECSNDMRNLILEQTYSIQFDVAVDIFDSCNEFEKYFINTNKYRGHMQEFLNNVKENMAIRKRRLAMNDLFEKGDTKNSIELIYEEVKVQFWATKMLLSSPLTSKLYSHFIKNVLEKKQVLNEDPAIKLEAEFEEFLQSNILYEFVDGNLVPKNNAKLSNDYDLNVKFDRFIQKYNKTKRILEYVTYALEGITKFKHHAHSEEVVNFLSHLTL
ncbi:conserved hypothetical protein [Theileria orientalis strain Shintoku]|uniref:Dynamin N-terminal domain-containing protein n=1 Tax=Theileria orientalis strain Shintoku TaxID=869250 RepID=J4C7J5_THEOR|nr:conserved hypothetical protein [Theileria orientalis strain Shintoku]PVC54849.1 hypothetical protein MACL_00003018 [Theileria orientalis]BAM39148.1 conserved hypothetical protein [Theileria orientalis strain Shintoku]|eukprot:XP_009689449.1 conserved hypothetical protein [Theileria orientalis strain Shintoku]